MKRRVKLSLEGRDSKNALDAEIEICLPDGIEIKSLHGAIVIDEQDDWIKKIFSKMRCVDRLPFDMVMVGDFNAVFSKEDMRWELKYPNQPDMRAKVEAYLASF